MKIDVSKIISGGQTGVDRDALDWAIDRGIDHGGWCPKGRISEEGVIPTTYNLKETQSDKYPARTRLNIADSNITIIIVPYEGYSGRGTKLTMDICDKIGAARFQIYPGKESVLCKEVVDALEPIDWASPGLIVNVAGPRGSRFKDSKSFVYKVLDSIFYAKR